MSEPVVPKVGQNVLHLFGHWSAATDGEAVVAAIKASQADGVQVVSAALLGHKADVGFMLIDPDLRKLRRFQTAVQAAGVAMADSYVSLTELSEYAQGIPEEMRQMRLYPELPPEGKPAFCFYPMSKHRNVGANWYTLDYDERKELMYEHGASGRKFAGRIVQVISGSTGLDDYEWGVTLFGQHIDDLKETVYTMRYDTASALYGDFGSFWTGFIVDTDELIATLTA